MLLISYQHLKQVFYHIISYINSKHPHKLIRMELKGMTFEHDFFVVVGKHCRTENVYAGHQHNIFI